MNEKNTRRQNNTIVWILVWGGLLQAFPPMQPKSSYSRSSVYIIETLLSLYYTFISLAYVSVCLHGN